MIKKSKIFYHSAGNKKKKKRFSIDNDTVVKLIKTKSKSVVVVKIIKYA